MKKKENSKGGYSTAYKKAVEEIEKDKMAEIKGMVKQTLENLVSAQTEVKKFVERIEFLKKDLTDLKFGRIDKIKKRHKEDKERAKFSQIDPIKIQNLQYGHMPFTTLATTISNTDIDWNNVVTGTYLTDNGSTIVLT